MFSFVHLNAIAEESVMNQLVEVDFQLSKKKEGVITVELASAAATVDLRKEKDKLIIELHDTKVSDDKLVILDVEDFATLVSRIETFREPSSTVLSVDVKGDYQYDYFLKGPSLQVVVSQLPESEKKSPISSNSEDKSKPISINFQDIPVRHVLQLIADYNDFNLVVADSVTGNLTLRLDGVPWQQVLDIILQVKGLDKRVEGNVVLIAPKTELDAQEQQVLEQAQMASELAALSSEILSIKYAKASDIAELLVGEGEITMLSSRGSITVDERTNSLLLRDLPENITVIKDIIDTLDIPIKQVQIEARIVTVNEGNLDELGVRWGITNTNGSTTVGGSIESNLAAVGLYDGGGSDDKKSGNNSLPVDDFLNVNLGLANPAASSIAFQVAKLGSDLLLDLELSALQAESKAEIISSPRLITTNKKPAYIEQGTEIPYLEASSSGATSVSFKKAVLSLMVTPQITPDNRLVLDLTVTQDRPGQVVKTGTGEAVAIDTQRIGTQVLVDNGETVVLGGIYQHSLSNSVEKVPVLGDLPLLGALFRRSSENIGKKELLIFVTPKVVIQ
ncbi:type IV pilus secretin PilQ [Aliivibrio fischeri]|uniref:type IV pilus secretin PilQ n=1 Tax=Aliivibrio fischeri TaxID=668 RepID=UPI0007C42BC7|nr:type IV pilus secretin PilQ family protein [Aliivibrio fischeri]MCE7555767.1 type IV pilus secretin PilQ family protein [Aliivibrio fischeri]MCE7563597.1 type IV pilus secretin PilQ family protein [Aliivibrio fischeri]MCE7570702.1 type IV pilus secretin PilQ family protein [Aliivibrio fischeri]MCE7578339.1 type IV pilus secretin PilQ family protein [Aliivibrio fischeri]MCE7590637.1 type IV pilus secretin PilQ family protein [Aliivibrio fischeri]